AGNSDRALCPDDVQRLDPSRRVQVGLQVGNSAGKLQLLRELRPGERERTPVVVGRDRVVRIRDRDEIRNRLPPDVLRGGRAATGGGEEERLRDLTLVENDLTRCRVDGRIRRRPLMVDAEVHLAARVRIETEGTRATRREGIRTSGD